MVDAICRSDSGTGASGLDGTRRLAPLGPRHYRFRHEQRFG